MAESVSMLCGVLESPFCSIMAPRSTATNMLSGKNSVLSEPGIQKYAEIGRITPKKWAKAQQEPKIAKRYGPKSTFHSATTFSTFSLGRVL
ncbi:MAG: hypothetical protein OXH06_09745, partial [Gemmatimonadetes bacterium]|nr:hypothetical protein [Gemmatimonadota bacterium]